MSITRTRVTKLIPNQEAAAVEATPKHLNQHANENQATTTTTEATEYERIRELRIKENKERLHKLGILDLSLQVNSLASAASKRSLRTPTERKTPLKPLSVGPIEPRRRSSRLQNAPVVTYVEPKEERPRKNRDIVLEEGSKPEFYTEEHEKLLGNTEMPWTFFVDGYRADGTRIYDPVNGKTCHQCRQKTMGKRTHCSQCKIVRGQFCGDCLYMRYGEHVDEANQNPNWICPPCRGICNCSLCRQAKGWAPTGALYRRISSLGYKSVAHYLMATKRAPPSSVNVSDTEKSVKRSLPFDGVEVPSDNISDEKALNSKNDITPQPEDNAEDVTSSKRKAEMENGNAGEESEKKIEDTVGDAVPHMKTPKGVVRSRKKSKINNVHAHKDSEIKDGKADKSVLEMKDGDSSSPNSDSFSKRLRPRNRSSMDNVGAGKDSKIKDRKTDESVLEMKGGDSLSPQSDSVSKRLRPTNKSSMDNGGVGEESELKDGKSDKPVYETKVKDSSSPNTDSVARRLRPRSRSLMDNAGAGEELEMKDGKTYKPVPDTNGGDCVSPSNDSVARRLRPRNRT